MTTTDFVVSFERTVMDTESITESPRKSKILKNPDVVSYYRSVFDQWDQNKDGYISVNELEQLIAANENIKISKKSLRILYAKFDANHDNLLDFDEFLDMINNPKFKHIFKTTTKKYLKFVDISKFRQTLILRRTVTNTGVYETQITWKWYNVFMITVSVLQIVLYYKDITYIKNNEAHGPINGALCFNPTMKQQAYRYFTYMLVHDETNKIHLFGNVIIQIGAGIPLEMVHGWRIMLIYIIGGLGGSLTHYAFDKEHGLQGASAGVYAFYTAHIATVILNWKEMVHPIFFLLVFAIMICFDLVYPLIRSSEYDTASHATHLGGAIVGLFLGMFILRNLVIKRYEKMICHICVVLFIIYMTALVIINIEI